MKHFALIAAVAIFCFVGSSYANPVLTLNETFQSGATFTGTLTFLPDYSNLVAALYASGQDTYTNVLLLWREPQDIAMNVKRLHGYVDDGGYGNLTSLKQMWVSK